MIIEINIIVTPQQSKNKSQLSNHDYIATVFPRKKIVNNTAIFTVTVLSILQKKTTKVFKQHFSIPLIDLI
jgi:hypothetical protein